MALTWNVRYSTGLAWQDNQHQELFKRINSLLDTLAMGKGTDSIPDVVSFLEKYVITHFGAEEKIMVERKLSCYASHKAAHEEFIRNFGELKALLLKGSSQTTVTIKLQGLLTTWLINHIGKADTAFAAELTAKVNK